MNWQNRAKDAARYPQGLCRAIRRGISKEKMLWACGITAMLSIRESVHLTSIDPEENHEKEAVDIEALIRKIEGQAQEERGRAQRRPADAKRIYHEVYQRGFPVEEFVKFRDVDLLLTVVEIASEEQEKLAAADYNRVLRLRKDVNDVVRRLQTLVV